MRSQTIAFFFAAGFIACGGSSPPAQSPDDVNSTPPPTAGPPPATPENLTGDVQADAKRNKFDEEQAKIVLARAATNAHTCVNVVDKEQPHGDGTVTVTFSGKGRSTNAKIAAPFEGTPIGQCATRAFVDIIIPPFEGADVDMSYQVNLKPDAKNAKKEAEGKGSKKETAKPKK